MVIKIKKFKIISIITAVVIILCTLAFTVKPIYYRIYPSDRFTVKYTVSCDGTDVGCKDLYYRFDGETDTTVLKSRENQFKIRGGEYGSYDIGLVVNPKSFYILSEFDDIFLGLDDLHFRFNYHNTNWWHITKFKININFVKIDGEWYAECKMVVSEPESEWSGKLNTYTLTGTFPVEEINTYDILPLSSD